MVEIRNIVCIRRFSSLDPLSSEVGEIGKLIGEHLVDAFLRQDAGACCGRDAVVEEGGEELRVVGWTGETACAGGVVDGPVFGRGGDERSAVRVIARSDVLTRCLLMHVG